MKEATTVSDLNEIRSLLVKGFSGYAGGRKFFGEKLMPITASSGSYKVLIYYGNVKGEEIITLRNDPLDN